MTPHAAADALDAERERQALGLAPVLSLPLQGTSYVIHHRAGTERVTVHVRATSISTALTASGLPSGSVHDAKFTDCDSCRRALSGGAVSGS